MTIKENSIIFFFQSIFTSTILESLMVARREAAPPRRRLIEKRCRKVESSGNLSTMNILPNEPSDTKRIDMNINPKKGSFPIRLKTLKDIRKRTITGAR